MTKSEIFKQIEEDFSNSNYSPSVGQIKNYVNSVTTRIDGIPSSSPAFLTKGDVIFVENISHPVLLIQQLHEDLYKGLILSTSAESLAMDVIPSRFGKQYVTGITVVESTNTSAFMFSLSQQEINRVESNVKNYV